MDRRRFAALTAGAAAATAAGAGCGEDGTPRWHPAARTKGPRSTVAVLRAENYESPVEDTIMRGIQTCGIDVRDRSVLLKPNFVEYDPDGVINTHPAVVHAAIVAFRRLGASEVVVGEGAGHRRDGEYLIRETGVGAALRDAGARFVDLNLDAVSPVEARSSYTRLGRLYLPNSILDADLVVSMPKLKTHHWAGVTLSLKNMFGIMPGAVYGWPKNVLHREGIRESILDINAALAGMRRFAIVDGIVGMEGNGPIQGEPRHSGVLVFGEDPVAVDATCCRLIGVNPVKVAYLREAAEFLGNLDTSRIDQRADDPTAFTQSYRLLERFDELRLDVASLAED